MKYTPDTSGMDARLKKNLEDISRVLATLGGANPSRISAVSIASAPESTKKVFIDFIPQDILPDWLEGRAFFDATENTFTVYGNSGEAIRYIKRSTATKLKLFRGFVQPTRGVTYDPATRTWTLTGTGTAEISWDGVISTITLPWTSPAHTATADVLHFLYSSDGVNYVTSTVPWDFNYTQVATAYYDSNSLYRFGLKETHGATQDPESHRQNHQHRGTYRVSGGTLTAGSYLIEPSSPTNAGNRPLFDATTISDEDLQTTNLASATESYTRYWASADGSRNWALASANIVGVGTTYPQWDNAGTPTELSTGKSMWIYRIEMPVTDDVQSQQFRTFLVSGSEFFNSKTDALAGAVKYRIGNLESLSPEFTCVRRILIETNASYTTVTGRFRIVTDELVEGSRTSSLQATSGAVTSVNSLTGAVLLTLDEIPDGATYKRWSLASFATSVLGTLLSGLSVASSTPIADGISILVALGRIQAQITSIGTELGNKLDTSSTAQTKMGPLTIERTSATNATFNAQLTGDTTPRLRVQADGSLRLTDGTNVLATISPTELAYLDGVASAVKGQTENDARYAKLSGADFAGNVTNVSYQIAASNFKISNATWNTTSFTTFAGGATLTPVSGGAYARSYSGAASSVTQVQYILDESSLSQGECFYLTVKLANTNTSSGGYNLRLTHNDITGTSRNVYMSVSWNEATFSDFLCIRMGSGLLVIGFIYR